MTQKQQLLDRLMPLDGKTLPGPWRANYELNAVCFAAYSQRLGDLKKEGYEHEKRRSEEDGAWYYRLTTMPDKNFPPCSSESVSKPQPPFSLGARNNSGIGPKTDPGDNQLKIEGIL